MLQFDKSIEFIYIYYIYMNSIALSNSKERRVCETYPDYYWSIFDPENFLYMNLLYFKRVKF